MPPTPSQIKEQLLKATDQDAKVTNMVSVLAAISCLENTQITKEALEETRLGKIVNDIRKNTLDSSLSTRCKKLVRIWSKQFVRGPAPSGTPSSTKQPSSTSQDDTTSRQPTPPTQGVTSKTPSGGKRTPKLKANTSTTPSSTSTVDKKKSENHKRRKVERSSPGALSSTGSTPSIPKKPRPAVNTTPTSNATKDNQQDLDKKNGMPVEKDASKTNLQSSKSAFAKVKPSDSKLSSSRTSSPALKAKGASSPGLSKLNAKTSKVLSKSPLTKPVLSAVNSSSSSKGSPFVVAASKASRSSPSVKAKQSTDSNCVDSSHEETDETRKDNEASKSDSALSRLQNKSPKQSVHKNLSDSNSSSATVKLRSPSPSISQQQTSFTIASSSVEYDTLRAGSQSSELDPFIPESSKTSFSMFDDDFDEEGDNHSDEKYSQMLSQIDTEKVLLSLAPSVESEPTTPGGNLPIEMTDETDGGVDEGEVCEEQEEEEEEVLPSKPVTVEDIQRIHQAEWDGVNGCYNNKREWFDWTQSLSNATIDDEALHILPYICLD
ncbi:mediator of RNA polymerase II transcription subunit 26-like isoform X1 [Asterias rubens]|uniref:mediator of RNA polymerase II transcription subunit 26-like isoform X1 n=2 Tax=Asterias rubens TaxID=7604 RepID=UPI0014556684|nr:mediator of RNA polymerase II transcription subunit 26-like isoform X1 [Asterias rubens]